jgi:hypothetical protein
MSGVTAMLVSIALRTAVGEEDPATTPPTAAAPEAPRDSDQDGLSDELERRTNTDPFDADSDDDGVPDGAEDRNRDGVVSHRESDPRRPGLFPGTAPHIPEPLVFDLVRGLGAARGELEVNTLAIVGLRDGHVHWAPEVEWAFARGHALELELPVLDRELEAVKLALQGTLPSGLPRVVHGWQTFGEVSLDDGMPRGVLLYLLGHRFARRWSYLGMLGGAAPLARLGQRQGSVLLNASLFADPAEWVTLGLESNVSVDLDGGWRVALFPQGHFQVGKRVRFQVAPGVAFAPQGVEPLAAVRLILE